MVCSLYPRDAVGEGGRMTVKQESPQEILEWELNTAIEAAIERSDGRVTLGDIFGALRAVEYSYAFEHYFKAAAEGEGDE